MDRKSYKEYAHAYYIAHKEARKRAAKDWYHSHPERSKEMNRLRATRLRQAALNAYGRKCACCGETTEEFLAIDHLGERGVGNRHRREIGSKSIYFWLSKNGYPPGFQTLCHNCNCARGFYGACPHVEQYAIASNLWFLKNNTRPDWLLARGVA